MNQASSGSWLKRTAKRLLRSRFRAKIKPSVVRDVFGHTLHQEPNDLAINFSVLSGVALESFQYGELGYFREVLRPGQRVVDLGANIGFYTLLFARGVGSSGRVFAFEPGPRSFAVLSQNVDTNGYANVALENLAVSNQSGKLQLLICRSGESDNRIAATGVSPDDRDCVEIGSTTLDDYFAHDPQPIDLIKIDIQGAEYLALQGMQRLLARSPNVRLVIEHCPSAVVNLISIDRYLAFLRGLGFRVFDLPEHAPRYEITDAELSAKYPPGTMTNLVLER